jgi:hypothetical protein
MECQFTLKRVHLSNVECCHVTLYGFCNFEAHHKHRVFILYVRGGQLDQLWELHFRRQQSTMYIKVTLGFD